MSEHPLHVLERTARTYARTCNVSERADQRASVSGAGAAASLRAAEARAHVITRSADLQRAAVAFALWSRTDGDGEIFELVRLGMHQGLIPRGGKLEDALVRLLGSEWMESST